MNPSSTSEKEIPTTLRTWLQTILRYNHVKLHVIERIRKEDIQKILHILSALLSDEHTKNVSFELCQQLLFNEEFINLFSVSFESVFELSLISFLSMTQTQNQHHDNHNQVKAENRQILSSLDRPDSISINTQKHRQHLLKSLIKSILSSFLIAKFPNDILNSTESPRSEGVEVDYSQLKLKSGECYFAAKLLLKHLYRLFAYILGWYKEGPRVYWPPWIKLMNFQRFYHNNVFALQHYLVAFHEWRKLDSLLLINSLELTFQQSYHQYLLIRRDLDMIRSHGGDLLSSVSLLSGSEGQLEKIQDMLKRILGPKKAVSRIEEIKATVEALNSQLNLSEDQVPIPSFPQNILESINQQAVTQIMNYSQAPLSEDSINSVALKQLEMLSRLAGLENERIAYEITYDKNYRLPVKNLVTASVEGENKSEDKSIAGYLKQTLLKRIADQLINSLRKSNIQSIEQLAEGMVVPVLVSEHSPSVNGQEIKLAIYLSAKILQLYPPNEVVGPVIDAEFLVDGQVERNVSFERVKIASKANNAYLLIQSLYDVIRQITLLIPNRKDLQMNLLKCFDEELISQMVEQDSLSSTDILPIFSYIYEFVQSLQAEYRLEYSKQWLADFIQACDESVSEEIRSANPIVQQSLERLIPLTYVNGEIDRSTVSKVLPFIPLFFERISEIVEEIQADMANYYISLLVPVLHKHGYQLLLQRFQQRLQVGNTSVHVLSAMIHVQFASEDNWNRTLNELIEAELFHTQEAITPSTMYNSITTNPEVVKSVAARVFLDVLQIPFRLDSIHVVQQRVLPETLYFDTKRLSLIRDLIDKIVLENSLLVTMKQLLSQKYKIMLSENEESEFIHRVDVLLSQQDLSQSFIYTECLRFAQSLIFVREQHQQHNHSLRSIAVEEHVQPRVLESDLGELLERSISDVVKEGNPVLQLFQKRIYKLLFRVILEKPHQLKLRQYSLQAKGLERNLHQLFNLSKALFRHNLRVYFPVYQIVLSTCLEKLIV